MVFDNLVLNLKSIVLTNKCPNDCDLIDGYNKFSTRNLFTHFRTYFNGRYAAVSGHDDNNDDGDLMFPRVYSSATYDYGNHKWDPVELKAREKVVEELDNVVDKFIRVINVDGHSSSASLWRSFHVGAKTKSICSVSSIHRLRVVNSKSALTLVNVFLVK